MTLSGPKGPKSSDAILIDTMHSCITEQEIPLTGADTPEKLDELFRQHCANRLKQLEHGASVYCDEESSITSK